MKRIQDKPTIPDSLRRVLWGLALLMAAVGPADLQGATQTQTLTLNRGWTAVWLDVDPAAASSGVTDVFTDSNVIFVARPWGPVGMAEFVSTTTATSEANLGRDKWAVWKRNPTVANTLTRIRGNAAYLVYVQDPTGAPVSVTVTGEAKFFRPTWAPGSYNLLGFSFLDAGMSFNDFFGPSGAIHPVSEIHSLGADGMWTKVTGTALMKRGVAYWVRADRNSAYMGPVSILFDRGDGLNFGSGPGTIPVQNPSTGNQILLSRKELTLTNATNAASPAVKLVKVLPATSGGAAASDALRLYEVTPRPNTLDYRIGGSGQVTTWTLGAVAAQTTRTVTLGAHRNWNSGERWRENLYRIEVGNQFFWLPARAANALLLGGTALSANNQYAGLWIGDVVLNEVTSIAETGSPLRPTTSTAPLRVLIHVDSNGVASLLSRVMIMRKKTADTSVAPETVLVVNEAKIPFYEGIEERGNKRIGRRIETIGFDMPRLLTRGAQGGLLEAVAKANGALEPVSAAAKAAVTNAQIAAYVNGRKDRPSVLAETYANSWTLLGGFGKGASITTPDSSPLTLDPFHRSNPFRHAFHPQHGAGFPIERHLTILLDDQIDADVLTGRYQERLQGPGGVIPGLTASAITMRGGITLRRVSAVNSLIQ